ncbi:MAG: IS481 family transposase [Syntrophobacteraceae bacterium]
MPWKVQTPMSPKKEFIVLASSGQNNISELCRRFGISRKTAYKWIGRYGAEGEPGLADKPKRPHSSPNETPLACQEAIIEIRKNLPTWGGRKIRHVLASFDFDPVPAKSTVNSILKRKGHIDPRESAKHKKWQSFEAPAPNDLWQMDFKGHFEAARKRCHPLTVLDDHSRYSICIKAGENETRATVQSALTEVFRTFGLPKAILCDNGPPWGDPDSRYTRLTAWLIRMGIGIPYARSFHPQTRGKVERFHRTLKADVVQYCHGLDLDECQSRFDQWRILYNTQRPHEALDMAVPASRYWVSPRAFPETLPPVEYSPGDHVRSVQDGGFVSYLGREFRVGKAFQGERVAIRPTTVDGILDVYFCDQKVSKINLKGDREKHRVD